MNYHPENRPPVPIFVVIFLGAILLFGALFALTRLASSPSESQLSVTTSPTQSQASDVATPTLSAYNPAPAGSTALAPPTPVLPTSAPETAQTAYQPLPPLPPEKRGLIFSGDRTEPIVALTFDVGETADNPAGFDWGIINVLNETETPATFFLGGLWMVHNPTETFALANNPLFELGNHAWSHLDFAIISPEEISNEISWTQQQMWQMFGWQTSLFRLPFGTYNDQALELIGDHGLLTIQWDVVSGDPDPNVLAGPMADWVIQQVQPGSIIIMHANGRGWHTAEALPEIISTLETQGYTFVTISDLLNIEPQTPFFN